MQLPRCAAQGGVSQVLAFAWCVQDIPGWNPLGCHTQSHRRLAVASVSNDHAGVFAKDTSRGLAKAAKT